MSQDQTVAETTVAEEATEAAAAAVHAAEEAAFAEGFTNEGQTAAPVEESTPVAAETTTVAEPETTAATATAPDPFEALPQQVKTALAAIPVLENELRRTQGRVAALQSAEDRRAQAAAHPAPAAAEHRSQAREAVETDMPEVAEFVREELARVTKAQAPAAEPTPTTTDQVSPEEKTLNEEYPRWGETLASTEFNAWLATQPPEYREKVTKTDKAAVVMRALGQFDTFRDLSTRATSDAQRLANLRRERAAGSVAPRGQGARPAATNSLTEDEAFEQGFKTG